MGLIMRGRKCYTGKVKESGVKLRATVTNSGNQTLRTGLGQLFSALETLRTTDPEKLVNARIYFNWNSAGNIFCMPFAVYSSQEGYQFFSISGDNTSMNYNKVMVYSTSYFVWYSVKASNGSFQGGGEDSNYTGWVSMELWY